MKVLAFAHAREQTGFSERTIDCQSSDTPRMILQRLAPGIDFSSARVALDCEYSTWDSPVGDAEELAIIPPVSGG